MRRDSFPPPRSRAGGRGVDRARTRTVGRCRRFGGERDRLRCRRDLVLRVSVGPVGDPSTPNTPVVRPPVLYLTFDGAIVAGSLRWSSWGGTVAHATGVYSASNCNPRCATGQRTNNPARVTLSSPGSILGHEVYRCFQLTVPAQNTNQLSCLKRQGSTYIYERVSTPTSNSVTHLRFYTPSGNIACEMFDDGTSHASVGCIMQKPPAIARLAASGRVSICQHHGLRCTGNLGDAPGIANGKLGYGSSKTVGRFRCKSAFAGVTCVVIKTGRVFSSPSSRSRRSGEAARGANPAPGRLLWRDPVPAVAAVVDPAEEEEQYP